MARCGVSTRFSHRHGFKSRPVEAIYVGGVCCWFFPLFREFFLRVLYCTVKQSGMVDEEPFCGCAPSKLSIYGS